MTWKARFGTWGGGHTGPGGAAPSISDRGLLRPSGGAGPHKREALDGIAEELSGLGLAVEELLASLKHELAG